MPTPRRTRPPWPGLLLILGLWTAVSASAVSAQSRTSSAIRGLVLSSTGFGLTGARVTIRDERTGTSRSVLTNPEGRYLLLQLQPGGPYTLTAEILGWRPRTIEDLHLQVGEMLDVDLALTPSAIEVEGIDVAVDRTEIFNPSQVGPATRLSERVVENLPIISRDVMELAVLSPLVKTTEDGGFSIAGHNERYNSLLIDGVLNKDLFGLTPGGTPGGRAGGKLIPFDAVAQYEVLVAPFDVRLSGFTGGVLNALTRTGTNEFRARGFAAGRNEALIGDLTLPSGTVDPESLDRSLLSFSAGGPIRRDRAHFFVAGEWERRRQPPAGYSVYRDPARFTRVSEATVSAIDEVLDGFGLRAGDAGPLRLSTDLSNVFARFDWSIDNAHRLTVRNIYARAGADAPPNRSVFDAYELGSNATRRESTSNVTSLQLFSDFGGAGANELTLQLHLTSDETVPNAGYPPIEIEAASEVPGGSVSRAIRAGAEFFSHANDVDQAVLRLTDAWTRVSDDGDTFVAGVTASWTRIDQLFLPGRLGEYRFASLADFRDGVPSQYQRTLLAEGEDPLTSFDVLDVGAFLQNEMSPGGGLTMRFGLRVDVPYVLREPPENPFVRDFGYRTTSVPSGSLLASPRWGFNWQSSGEGRTQVRGGAGIFVGQIPYVWLANPFQYDGRRTVTAICRGRVTDAEPVATAAPLFDPATPPTGCADAPFELLRPVVVFEDDFKYPQDLKFSVTVDRELTDRLTASAGILFNKAINQVHLREINLNLDPGRLRDVGDVSGYGGYERVVWGLPTETGLTPVRRIEGFDQILVARNKSDDWGASLRLEVRGELTDRIGLQAGWAWARSFDKMSLVSTDHISNFGFTPTPHHPNFPRLEPSNFDRPHKFVLALFGAPFAALEDTRISLLYTGQSGAPYSYVYRGDLNGDGYPGLGPAFDRTNDMIYVPNSADEIPASPASLPLIAAALEQDSCMRANRGAIMTRNACRAPWQHRLDMRVSQALRVGGAEVRFEADVINVLNLLNGSWGHIRTVRPVVPVIEPYARSRSTVFGTGTLLSRWAGPTVIGEGGRVEVVEPLEVETPGSQWQMQFGVRVTFGGSGR